MKKEWSRKWVGSKKPNKQRKYRLKAPAHVRHKFLAVHLSLEMRAQLGKRALPVRKGDEVEIVRGDHKKLKGVVERVDAKKGQVYVAGVKAKKIDGSEVAKPLQPSNLKLIKVNTDDKFRLRAIHRAAKVIASKPKSIAVAPEIKAEKPAKEGK